MCLKPSSYRFVVPNGGDLRAEHDGGEEGEEESFEQEKEEKDDCGRRREGRTTLPLR